MKKIVLLMVLSLSLMFNASPASSDQTPYVYTKTYQQPYPGEKEIEIYTDASKDASGKKSYEYQLEYERGIDQNQSYSIYADIKDKGEGASLDGYKFEYRAHIAPYQKYFFDPALYLEYKASTEGRAEDELECKLILSRDFQKKWNFSGNLIWEKEVNRKSDTLFEYTAGFAYKYQTFCFYSLEFKGSPSENEFFIIPGISVPIDSTKRNRLNLGIGKGFKGTTGEYIARAVTSIEF